MAWSLPRHYAHFVIQTLGMQARYPVAEPIEPGNYGRIKDGVFEILGHVDQWKLKPKIVTGGSQDFVACSRKVRLVQIKGASKVPSLPSTGKGRAEIRIEFSTGNAFFLRARGCTSVRLKAPQRFAMKLAEKVEEWKHSRWLVVQQVWTAPSCLVLGSRKAGDVVTFEGEVSALAQVHDGKVSAGVSWTGVNALGFEILGHKGPVTIKTFAVRRNGEIV